MATPGQGWRHAAPSLPLLILVVVVDLEQQAAGLRFERPVRRARRAAGIGVGAELRAALAVPVTADDQVSRDEINLLPVFVHERLGGVDPGREAQVARTVPAPFLLVEGAGEDLLLDAARIALGRFPPLARIGRMELLVLFVDRHGATLQQSRGFDGCAY